MVGVSVMVLVVGGGLMSLFDAYPLLSKVLQAVSIAYLLWLAWKIANAAPLKASDEKGTPMTFLQAAAFQWVNPKAWAMCLSAITLYAPDRTLLSVVMVACVFAMVSFPAISIWAWLGLVVRQWLTSPKRNRAFNITMAVLLVGSLYPVLA